MILLTSVFLALMTLGIMGLKYALFVMVLLIADSASERNQAYFGDTGELPCRFKNPQNISLNELVVFWQNQDKVLFELYEGKEKPDNVHPKYKGRTSFDLDSWTLYLHNIEIKDKGSYHCYAHRLQPNGMVPLHQMNIVLSVLANFSQPEIMKISNGTENSGIINVTCSSKQGYPEPIRMFFVIKTENSSDTSEAEMNKYQDNVTELYTVSASLSFPVPPEAKTVNVSCALESKATVAMLYSSSLSIDVKPYEPPSDPDHTLGRVAIIVVVITVVVMVLFVIQRKKKKKQPAPSHENAIRMEEGERGRLKDRVKYHVPESSDEAHCVVNTQKTATDDKSATHF
ncbi:T-lymphocyte activation antigen CD86 isoform X2 [Talpa occidentalis]|uniref:T-lymphocyte activation antigen CD86 isoform X2 n=1 Tax=Talpa occidentalis TaxID=50954 RepID=UPI0023F790C8|nr:T-lymphocyte activation antigen CD86 isoform X2 [Talpa occidentalis]